MDGPLRVVFTLNRKRIPPGGKPGRRFLRLKRRKFRVRAVLPDGRAFARLFKASRGPPDSRCSEDRVRADQRDRCGSSNPRGPDTRHEVAAPRAEHFHYYCGADASKCHLSWGKMAVAFVAWRRPIVKPLPRARPAGQSLKQAPGNCPLIHRFHKFPAQSVGLRGLPSSTLKRAAGAGSR